MGDPLTSAVLGTAAAMTLRYQNLPFQRNTINMVTDLVTSFGAMQAMRMLFRENTVRRETMYWGRLGFVGIENDAILMGAVFLAWMIFKHQTRGVQDRPMSP